MKIAQWNNILLLVGMYLDIICSACSYRNLKSKCGCAKQHIISMHGKAPIHECYVCIHTPILIDILCKHLENSHITSWHKAVKRSVERTSSCWELNLGLLIIIELPVLCLPTEQWLLNNHNCPQSFIWFTPAKLLMSANLCSFQIEVYRIYQRELKWLHSRWRDVSSWIVMEI